MNKEFLVAVDGSDYAWKAADMASDLATSDAELLVLHVVLDEPSPEGLRRFAELEGVPIDEERFAVGYQGAMCRL